jgi:hypothetical protein
MLYIILRWSRASLKSHLLKTLHCILLDKLLVEAETNFVEYFISDIGPSVIGLSDQVAFPPGSAIQDVQHS